MRFLVANLGLAWLVSLTASGAHAGFAFAGFQRDMNLAALLDSYPRSSHTVNPSDGVRKRSSQDDEKEWMREFFHSHGSGTYILRLAPGESHDHLYYVQAEVREGATERLWLLLEMPAELMKPVRPAKSNEVRYPACQDVLGPLTAKYGAPQARSPGWEEALETFDYVWTRSPEVMKLQCGRYEGRKFLFGIGVTFEKTASQ